MKTVTLVPTINTYDVVQLDKTNSHINPNNLSQCP